MASYPFVGAERQGPAGEAPKWSAFGDGDEAVINLDRAAARETHDQIFQRPNKNTDPKNEGDDELEADQGLGKDLLANGWREERVASNAKLGDYDRRGEDGQNGQVECVCSMRRGLDRAQGRASAAPVTDDVFENMRRHSRNPFGEMASGGA